MGRLTQALVCRPYLLWFFILHVVDLAIAVGSVGHHYRDADNEKRFWGTL